MFDNIQVVLLNPVKADVVIGLPKKEVSNTIRLCKWII